MTFPADGGDLEFLRVSELAFPDHTLSFCLWIKVMDPRLILRYYPVWKNFWLGL